MAVNWGGGMQEIDHYLRQAEAARKLAASAKNKAVREQFEIIAKTWESLAQERLAFLQLKLRTESGKPARRINPADASDTQSPANLTGNAEDLNPPQQRVKLRTSISGRDR